MADTPTVALLGTGIMGAGMARNIAKAGLPLRVWNRHRAKAEPLAEAGATVVDTPAQAVRDADVVVTMLWDADSVVATIGEMRDSLGPGSVFVQMSTVGIEGERRIAGALGDLGVAYVDAPVLGTRAPAENGALTVLASGPAGVRQRIEPVFEAVGQKTIWLDEAGQGQRLKLVSNNWVGTVLDGVATTLALARELGLDPQLFLEAVKGGALDAPYVQVKGAAMLADEFEPPAFALSGAAKDMALIEEAFAEARLPADAARIIRAHFDEAVRAGLGDRDMAAVYTVH